MCDRLDRENSFPHHYAIEYIEHTYLLLNLSCEANMTYKQHFVAQEQFVSLIKSCIKKIL